MANSQRPIALITGGSRGLGRSMAEHLAKQGVDLIITYRSRADEADAVVKHAREAGARCAALQLDVSDASTFGNFVERLQKELRSSFDSDRFDYLVNNAGTGLHASFLETTEEQLDALVNIHLKGPFLLTQKLVPLLRDGGRILNVSSGLARFTLPGYGAYAAVKGAIEVLSRYQAKELGERKITVNTLAPGAIATDFGGGVVRDNPQVNAMVAAATALGRVGQPDDVGAAVALLLSPGSAWITGQRIEVSGGQSL
ncbi:MAG: SDR family oxidoreductase [Myxococcales bacterium]|nr:SDR family oxidoreductase [Myxococcales bacterium]MCB9575707.1 SDR family oxidoreductase [Polyangiaceae bacterium]